MVLIVKIFRWGSTDAGRVYFDGVLWENAKCQDRSWKRICRGASVPRWAENHGVSDKSFRAEFIPRLGQRSAIISGYLNAWFEQRQSSQICFFPQVTIKLGQLGGLGKLCIFSQTKIRASERQHRLEVLSTVAHSPRADLKLRFCHLPAA